MQCPVIVEVKGAPAQKLYHTTLRSHSASVSGILGAMHAQRLQSMFVCATEIIVKVTLILKILIRIPMLIINYHALPGAPLRVVSHSYRLRTKECNL